MEAIHGSNPKRITRLSPTKARTVDDLWASSNPKIQSVRLQYSTSNYVQSRYFNLYFYEHNRLLIYAYYATLKM